MPRRQLAWARCFHYGLAKVVMSDLMNAMRVHNPGGPGREHAA